MKANHKTETSDCKTDDSSGQNHNRSKSASIQIHCSITDIKYRNETTLYTVVSARDNDTGELFTAVGEIPFINEGEDFIISGKWAEHPIYGKEFKIENATALPPSTIEGIERYLIHTITGVGKKTAEKIVRKFGNKTIEVIEKQPFKLHEIKKLSKKTIRNIIETISGKRKEREIMLFLYSHGITPSYANRIFARFGVETIDTLKQNPYIIAQEIHGIGFKMADKLALTLGISCDSPLRIKEAMLFILNQHESDGHCFLEKDCLISKTRIFIETDQEKVEKCLQEMVSEGRLVEVRVSGEEAPDRFCIYPRSLATIECRVASYLASHIKKQNPPAFDKQTIEKEIKIIEEKSGIRLAQAQFEAVVKALTEKISIITGGPGTGKTTTIKVITSILSKNSIDFLLCAPTGRAAKKLSEVTGFESKTIHRLLKWNPAKGSFLYNKDNPLKTRFIIIDEVSMVDIRLFHYLINALEEDAQILAVGDADQLPSVGPGSVLKELISSEVVACTQLRQIFRQAKRSMIIMNAHRINRGEMVKTEPENEQIQDFYFIERKEPEIIANTVIELATVRIPSKFSLSPLRDIQVLSPMHKGPIGVEKLNLKLAQILNEKGKQIPWSGLSLKTGDRVMQTKNNYNLEVFNGEVGTIVDVIDEEQKVVVNYDGRFVIYSLAELDQIVRAYAISIHKSQGSEYPAVVIPISTAHYIMLQRNLLYTALTRARRLAVFVGTKKALAIGIKNNTVKERNTLLAKLIRGEIKPFI